MHGLALLDDLTGCVVFHVVGDEGLAKEGVSKLKMPKPRSSTKMSETDKTRVMIVLVFMVRPFFP